MVRFLFVSLLFLFQSISPSVAQSVGSAGSQSSSGRGDCSHLQSLTIAYNNLCATQNAAVIQCKADYAAACTGLGAFGHFITGNLQDCTNLKDSCDDGNALAEEYCEKASDYADQLMMCNANAEETSSY